MSASLFLFVPLALLAIVLLLSFLGCNGSSSSSSSTLPANPPAHFFDYTNGTILPTPGLLAYWPLGETVGPTAVNSHTPGTNNGTYTNTTFFADSNVSSAAASGILAFGQTGLLDGDLVPATTGSPRTKCISVDGGYVVIPASSTLNPPPAYGFTIEAWVRVGWTSIDPAYRAVLTSQLVDLNGNVSGFALYATPANCWEVSLGTGPTVNTVATVTSDPSCLWEATYYLAATYEPNTSTLALYVDGSKVGDVQLQVYYNVNWTGPLYIGAGPNQLPSGPAYPNLPNLIYPFNGYIQAVAIYQGALSATTILKHCHNGNGYNP
jgi:hypothetical protein